MINRQFEKMNDRWEWEKIDFKNIKVDMIIRSWDVYNEGVTLTLDNDNNTEFRVTKEPYECRFPDIGIKRPLFFDSDIAYVIDVVPARSI